MIDFLFLGLVQIILFILPIASLIRSYKLEQQIKHLKARLDDLQRQTAAQPHGAPVATHPVPEATTTAVAPTAPKPLSPVIEPPHRPARQHTPVAASPKATTSVDVESLLGGHILSRIGVVAMLIGLVYFYLWAVDQGWITEWVRITIGTLVGTGAFVVATRLQRRSMTTLAQAVAAVGSGALILTVHAAYAWYELVPFFVAYCGLLATVLLTMWQADAHKSIWLAIVASITSMAVPAILTSPNPTITGLLTHLALIDLMIIGTVLLVRGWGPIASIAALGTMLWLGVATMGPMPEAPAIVVPMFLLLFVVAGPLATALLRRNGLVDHVLGGIGASLYSFVVLTYITAADIGVMWMAADAVALAALAVLLHRWYSERLMESVALISGIVLVWVYSGKLPYWQWPLMHSASLIGSVIVARLIQSSHSMWSVAISAAIGLLMVLSPVIVAVDDNWLLYPFANVIVLAGMLYLAALSATVRPWRQWTLVLQPIHGIRSAILVGGVWLLALETYRIVSVLPTYMMDTPHTVDTWWASLAATSVFVIGCICVGWLLPARWWTQSRLVPVTMSAIASISLLMHVWAVRRPDLFTIVMNGRFTIEALVLLFMILASRSSRERLPWEAKGVSIANVMIGVMSFSMLSAEVILPWQRQIAEAASAGVSAERYWNGLHITVSVAWIAYGVVALLAGFLRRKRTVRLAGIGVLAVAILKVFLYDLSFLDTPSRMMSFGVLGLVLLGVSYSYGRWKHRILE
jgi:Predicted membrane protein (DUF2339)